MRLKADAKVIVQLTKFRRTPWFLNAPKMKLWLFGLVFSVVLVFMIEIVLRHPFCQRACVEQISADSVRTGYLVLNLLAEGSVQLKHL